MRGVLNSVVAFEQRAEERNQWRTMPFGRRAKFGVLIFIEFAAVLGALDWFVRSKEGRLATDVITGSLLFVLTLFLGSLVFFPDGAIRRAVRAALWIGATAMAGSLAFVVVLLFNTR
jgi:hypothetical protein